MRCDRRRIVEFEDVAPRRQSQTHGQCLVAEQARDVPSQVVDILELGLQAVDAMVDQLPQPGRFSTDDRAALQHGFEGRVALALPPRRHNDAGGPDSQVGDLLWRQSSSPADGACQARVLLRCDEVGDADPNPVGTEQSIVGPDEHESGTGT
jgi:hypothetical protein